MLPYRFTTYREYSLLWTNNPGYVREHYADPLFSDKTIKLWKVSERDKKIDGYNLPPEGPPPTLADSSEIRVPTVIPMELMVEASPRRVFANAHTYHINSISVNSDQVTSVGMLISGSAQSSVVRQCVFYRDECRIARSE